MISFSVRAKAEPQGSLKAFILEGKVDPRQPCDEAGKPNWERRPRAIITSDNKDLKAYRETVSLYAHNALVRAKLPKPMAGKHIGVGLEIQFTFVKPPSVTSKRKQMVVRPDADKCLRSTLDALTGILYLDDSQVVEIATRKQYGAEERVDITAHILASDQIATPQFLPLVEDF